MIEPALVVTLHPYPVEGTLEVDCDTTALSAAGKRPAELAASLLQSGKEVKAAAVPLAADADQAIVSLPIATLLAGKYLVRVTARDAQQHAIVEQEALFEMLPPPLWLGTKEGLEPKLPVGWPAVQAEGTSVKVWKREYRFAGGLFPGFVSSQGVSLLADAPIAAQVRWPGGEATFTGPPAALVHQDPSQAVLQAKAEAGPFRLEGKISVEFDGMTRIDFTLSGPPGEKLESFRLTIPIKAEHATYLHYDPGKWRTTENSRALPAEGWTGPFKPYVWLGDEERGFSWFAETDEHWTPADNPQAIEVKREGNVAVMQLNVIASPVTLDKPIDFTFGFQATPVKEITQDAWDYRIVRTFGYGLESQPYRPREGETSKATTELGRLAELGVRTLVFHEGWTDVQNHPSTRHGEKLHRLIKACHERNISVLLYFGYEMSELAPQYRFYGDECLVYPKAGGYQREPKQTTYVVCYQSHWQDFMAEGIANIMDEYDADGVYLDGMFAPWCNCANLHHGCGYRRADGSLHGTYAIFASREIMKRVYNIVKSRKPHGQLNVHNSTAMLTPGLAFATSSWDGEQLGPNDRGPESFSLLPLDAFRTEFMGRQWGTPAEFLCYDNHPFTFEEAMSITLIHDVLARGSLGGSLEMESALWQTMDEFGRRQADWLPYWSNQQVVHVEPEACKVSIYNRGPKGAVIIISNLGEAAADVRLALKSEALKLPAGTMARDILSGEQLSWDGATLRTAIPSHSFRAVRISA